MRCLVRDRARARALADRGFELHEADVLDEEALRGAGEGVEIAYYLIHALGRGTARGGFERRDHFTDAHNPPGADLRYPHVPVEAIRSLFTSEPPLTASRPVPWSGAPPDRLRISIDGFTGPSYEVELQAGDPVHAGRGDDVDDSKPLAGTAVDIEHQLPGFDPYTEIRTRPSVAAWRCFWQELDFFRVWDWAADHERAGVLGGTGWSLELAWQGRHVSASSSNAYPPEGGDADASPVFARFCEANSRLVDYQIG